MALSQCLDDSPLPRLFQRDSDARVPDWYNERHRLALEELVSGGPDSFHAFLKKERIPNFLSDDEVHRITSSAAVPRCASACGEDAALEHSLGVSVDCSSVTYFPDVSDVEPPVLEMGWPAFTTGSFRGITRAVAHFQPGYGGESESIYSCKEAARRMIRSAKEVIAVVTDSLTDLDIFRDLQEACTRRRVPVYLLLDQSCVPSFLQMCRNASVRLEELRLMCVRTITGPTYFLRSGAKIVGEVHERFMLIDGNRVATGSYRFNWTDGKLNSSNLMELSGQISEKFDEEFRILYAQSLPLPQPKAPPTKCQALPGAKSNGVYDRLLLRPPVPEPARLSSTPTRAAAAGDGDGGGPPSDVSTIGDDWMEREPAGDVPAPPVVPPAPMRDVSTQTGTVAAESSTQTSVSMSDGSAQTEPPVRRSQPTPPTSASSDSDRDSPPRRPVAHSPLVRHPPDAHLRDCFRKLTKERQYHYSTIRSKLDHMVALLAQRRELGDLTNLPLGLGARRVMCRAQGRGTDPAPAIVDSVPMGPWSRTRCLQ
ncbi:protein FAM83D [Scleropages formosus]|uniref:Family with sequence similarity 83 member D n=1 Tax=Scleropages formosus TaxID=113540 RepID=A0A8C9SJW0_SCLFO|nr:protein FAM83D-like [Scleropages formosus]